MIIYHLVITMSDRQVEKDREVVHQVENVREVVRQDTHQVENVREVVRQFAGRVHPSNKTAIVHPETDIKKSTGIERKCAHFSILVMDVQTDQIATLLMTKIGFLLRKYIHAQRRK